MRKGTLVRPQDIALLAMAGRTSVNASKKTVVSVISSGNESVEPSEKPGLSQIRNTNSYQLMAQIERAGATGIYLGIAKDDEDETSGIINEAISLSDVVLITGGVSMGDYDFVPSVLRKKRSQVAFFKDKYPAW